MLKVTSAHFVVGSLFGVGCLAALWASVPAAIGAPLDVAACDAATVEQGQLSDVPPLLERGPDWAKAHAPPQALKRVARWIELQEIVSFRCGRGRVTAEAQRAGAAANLIENPPPPPPKEGPAKEAAAAANDAAVAAKDAAAAAKDAAAAAAGIAVPAGAAGLAGVAAQATKSESAKTKLRSKPKTEPPGSVEPGVVAETPASVGKKKKVGKPTDAYVPPQGSPPSGATN